MISEDKCLRIRIFTFIFLIVTCIFSIQNYTYADIDENSTDYKEPQMGESQNKVDEAVSKFNSVSNFSCNYNYAKESVGAYVSSQDNPDQKERMKVVIDGVLTYEKPDKLNFKYRSTDNSFGPPTQKQNFIIADGHEMWLYNEPSPNNNPPPQVIKEDIKNRQSRFDSMLSKIGKMKELYGRSESGSAPSQDSLYEISMIDAVRDPMRSLGFIPFEGLKQGNIIFESQEELNGEPVYKFDVKKADSNRRAIHWIGQKDGIPRKINEFNPYTDELETEIILSSVKTNIPLELKDFKYNEGDANLPVVDFNDIGKLSMTKEEKEKFLSEHPEAKELIEQMEKTAQMEKDYGKDWSLDVPPEVAFKDFFENALNEITDLRGGGLVIIGGEVFIQFKSEKDIIPKHKSEYTQKDPAEAIDWFKKAFPDVLSELADNNELVFFTFQKKNDQRWFLTNKSKKRFFFRAWGGGMD